MQAAAFARLRLCLSLARSLSRFSRRLRLPERRERTRTPMPTERGTYHASRTSPGSATAPARVRRSHVCDAQGRSRAEDVRRAQGAAVDRQEAGPGGADADGDR